jgi:hypothetical protein
MKLLEEICGDRRYQYVKSDPRSESCRMEEAEGAPMSLEEYIEYKKEEYSRGVEEDKKYWIRMTISREDL